MLRWFDRWIGHIYRVEKMAYWDRYWRIKWAQSGSETMSQTAWEDWIDGLPVPAFISCMLTCNSNS